MEFVQLTRNCPECGDVICYATRKGMERAGQANSLCPRCRGKLGRGTLGKVKEPKRYERVCSGCSGVMIYKSGAALRYSEEHDIKCKNCKGHHCKGCRAKVQAKNKTGYCLDCYQNTHLPSVRLADAYDLESWKRPCPKCGREISYTTYCGFILGKKRNSSCIECAVPRRIPKHCSVCKTVELNPDNTSGMCAPCYANHHRLLPHPDEQYSCPECGNSIVYSYKNRKEGRRAAKEKLPCVDCRRKNRLSKPLLTTCSCVVCDSSFMIDRRTQNPRLTCSDKCYLAHRRSFSTYTTAEFIERAKKVHGDTWYDYSKANYTGVLDKIVITCTKHGDFQQLPRDHLTGSGCPKCKGSHGERLVRIYLEAKKIAYEYQKRFPDCVNPKTGAMLIYDFYVPDYNLLIEYDGIQHYQYMPQDKWRWCRVTSVESLESLQERDKLKDQYAKDKGIEMLRINFMQKNHIEQILEKELASLSCRTKSHTLYSTICQTSDTF